MDTYEQIALKIITSQENIIGPVAIEQAQQIPSLHVEWATHSIGIVGDKKAVIEELIQKYKLLFGHISVEVSRQAAGSLLTQLPTDSLPASLK